MWWKALLLSAKKLKDPRTWNSICVSHMGGTTQLEASLAVSQGLHCQQEESWNKDKSIAPVVSGMNVPNEFNCCVKVLTPQTDNLIKDTG